ncbi:MAG: CRISPR-associated CARF protein Csa3 [Candidatus Nanoarchaeia archaeon]
MPKVLIATLHSAEPVLLSANRLGPDRIILLVNKEKDKVIEASLKTIKDSLGRVIDVKVVKTDAYDVVAVATKAVEIIDLLPTEDQVYVNITSGRKTQAIGLLFAAYARSNQVKKVAYSPTEPVNTLTYLPKLSFNLTESQKLVLEAIGNSKFKSHTELAEKVEISKAMLYRNIKDLEDMGLIETEEGFKLTDAGRIAVL